MTSKQNTATRSDIPPKMCLIVDTGNPDKTAYLGLHV